MEKHLQSVSELDNCIIVRGDDMKRTVLTAKDGNVYTNGEVYAKKVFLEVGADKTKWVQVSESEMPVEETPDGAGTVAGAGTETE